MVDRRKYDLPTLSIGHLITPSQSAVDHMATPGNAPSVTSVPTKTSKPRPSTWLWAARPVAVPGDAHPMFQVPISTSES
jgi:hypothetical protein